MAAADVCDRYQRAVDTLTDLGVRFSLCLEISRAIITYMTDFAPLLSSAAAVTFISIELQYPHHALSSTSTTTVMSQAATPPVPFYLSGVSQFLLQHQFFSCGRLRTEIWQKHDQAFVKAFPSAFDNRKPKVIPRIADGKKMSDRYWRREYVPKTKIFSKMLKFKQPYSTIKCIHGPSKLRVEIKAEEDNGPSAGSELDFRPVRSKPQVCKHPNLRDKLLLQTMRGTWKLVAVHVYRDDPRKITLEKAKHQARCWEALFGKYEWDKPVYDKDKALDRRGCWWNGGVVSVADDEIFPGWGEKCDSPDPEESFGKAPEFGTSATSPVEAVSVEAEVMDLDVDIGSRGVKRRRAHDDDEGIETASVVKKLRVA